MLKPLTLIATLLIGCSGNLPAPTIPTSTEPCQVLRLTKPPPLHFANGALPLEDRIALILWIADVEETRIGLEGCPLVRLVVE